mgnify:CR=1 FL=1
MAEYFKLVVTPKGTHIITFTGVDEDFAQKYGDTLAYAKMLAGDNGKNDEYKPILDSTDLDPLSMEYMFAHTSSAPLTEEQQAKLAKEAILRKEKEAKQKARKQKQLESKLSDPDSIEGRYARYNYKKRIKKRAAIFRSYAFINFVPKTTQFVTLTFDNRIVADADKLDVAHQHFRKFIKRVQSRFSDLKYAGTFSRQKNGNWHYHMFFNFDESVSGKEINNMWKYGVAHCTLITSGDDFYSKISYCIDNMYKVSYSDLKGEKGYLHANKLQSSIEFRSWNEKEADKAYELLHEILQSSLDKPTPRNSVMLEKGKSFFSRIGSLNGEPYEIKMDDKEINYLYSTKGFPELFKKPVVAKRK